MTKTVSRLLKSAGWFSIAVSICLFSAGEAAASTGSHCEDTSPACNGFCFTSGYYCNLEMLSCACMRYIA